MHLRTFRIATQAVGHVRAVQVLPAAEHADRQEAGRGGRLLRIGRLSGRPPAGTNDSTICFPCLFTDKTTFSPVENLLYGSRNNYFGTEFETQMVVSLLRR